PPRQQPGNDDDEHAEQDPEAQPGHEDAPEQRLVEGNEEDDADVDGEHHQRQGHGDAPARGGETFLFHRGIRVSEGGAKKNAQRRAAGSSARGVGRPSEFGKSYGSLRSSGAPVPDEPTNSFLPSGKVMSRPFARNAPSFAWKPSTRISVPGGSELRFQPRRMRAFGAPPSTIHSVTVPSGFFTSMWIHECGLIHS